MKAMVYYNYGSPDILELKEIEKNLPPMIVEVLLKVIGLMCVSTWEMSKKPWTGVRKK